MNIFSFVYLAVFLLAGFCIARKALPQAGLSVSIPLGCGFGVSLLAFVPACFAVVLGFRLPALLLAAAVVAALAAWLARHGTPFTRVPDPDAAALWACVLPLAVVTLYLLHTHVLHLVDGSYHTGQSCYGDMAMHLGFIKNIAVTGKLPPVYPLLGGEHRFGYPFLCETVSSVFLVLGADARTAYLLPMLAAFISVYGMMWQLARQVLGSAGKACLAFWLFFMGSGFGFVYFLGSAEAFAGIFTGFYTTPTNYTAENIVWVNPIVDLLIPQRATLFGWCVLFPALYLVWRGGNPALAVSRPAGSAPATDAHPQRTGAGADLPGVRGVHPGLPPPHQGRACPMGMVCLGVRRGLAGRNVEHRVCPIAGRAAHAAAAFELDQRAG